jgi:hypothetical protein
MVYLTLIKYNDFIKFAVSEPRKKVGKNGETMRVTLSGSQPNDYNTYETSKAILVAYIADMYSVKKQDLDIVEIVAT